MINWYKRIRIESRIFSSRADKDRLIKQAFIHKIELYIRQIDRIKQALMDNDTAEYNRRIKTLNSYGMNPPKTLKDCENLIKDLREWQVM